jgi:tRNA (guanine-N7-)-methyltransferase
LRPGRIAEQTARIAERRDDLARTLSAIISPSKPFVWEVGSGHGHFLAAYASKHPDHTCVGIDIASDRVVRANRKRERGRLANLHFLLADAEDFLAVMPADARFSAIYILFPDPWPKRRHHKNRVMKPEFLGAVASRAGKGTSLHFRTDHEPYFRDVVAAIRGHPDWIESDSAEWPFEEPTVFEKRASGHFTLVASRR